MEKWLDNKMKQIDPFNSTHIPRDIFVPLSQLFLTWDVRMMTAAAWSLFLQIKSFQLSIY